MIAFIEEHQGDFGVEPTCRVLPIAHRAATGMRPSPGILIWRQTEPVSVRQT